MKVKVALCWLFRFLHDGKTCWLTCDMQHDGKLTCCTASYAAAKTHTDMR